MTYLPHISQGPQLNLALAEHVAKNKAPKAKSTAMFSKHGGIWFIRIGSWRISICKVRG